MLTAGLMLAFKCLSADQARESVEWEVYVCIAFAFAVSAAMEETNLALAIAQLFAALGEWLMKLCASHIFAAGPGQTAGVSITCM
jgi:di/tricarboxylate transporter